MKYTESVRNSAQVYDLCVYLCVCVRILKAEEEEEDGARSKLNEESEAGIE